jgi:hypothetical protein
MSEIKTSLPKSLNRFFWEYDFLDLSWTSDSDLITSRLLQAGDWRSVCWLREQIDDDHLRRWLLEHKGGGLSPRQLRYWQVTLELPSELLDGWVHTARDNPWGRRIRE